MLTLIFTLLVIIALIYGVYFLWKHKINAELAEGARNDYERLRRSDPELIRDMTQEEFAKLHYKVEVPRYPSYLVAAICSFLAGIPFLLMLLAAGSWLLTKFGVQELPDELINTYTLDNDGIKQDARIPPEALHFILRDWAGFYYFFGFLAFWIFVFYICMRRYHARTPAGLREEIIRSRIISGGEELSDALGNSESDGEGDDKRQPDGQSA